MQQNIKTITIFYLSLLQLKMLVNRIDKNSLNCFGDQKIERGQQRRCYEHENESESVTREQPRVACGEGYQLPDRARARGPCRPPNRRTRAPVTTRAGRAARSAASHGTSSSRNDAMSTIRRAGCSSRQPGFTLIEILIAVVLIAILAVIVLMASFLV